MRDLDEQRHILLAHLRAATFELPFASGETFGGAPADDLLAFLAEEGHVRLADDERWYWASENFPASEISLRSAAPENVLIIDNGPDRPRVLGEIDLFAARTYVHQHAIYLHESRQYHVDRLDWDERKAYVRPVDADHYTQAEIDAIWEYVHEEVDDDGELERHFDRVRRSRVRKQSRVTAMEKLREGFEDFAGPMAEALMADTEAGPEAPKDEGDGRRRRNRREQQGQGKVQVQTNTNAKVSGAKGKAS